MKTNACKAIYLVLRPNKRTSVVEWDPDIFQLKEIFSPSDRYRCTRIEEINRSVFQLYDRTVKQISSWLGQSKNTWLPLIVRHSQTNIFITRSVQEHVIILNSRTQSNEHLLQEHVITQIVGHSQKISSWLGQSKNMWLTSTVGHSQTNISKNMWLPRLSDTVKRYLHD